MGDKDIFSDKVGYKAISKMAENFLKIMSAFRFKSDPDALRDRLQAMYDDASYEELDLIIETAREYDNLDVIEMKRVLREYSHPVLLCSRCYPTFVKLKSWEHKEGIDYITEYHTDNECDCCNGSLGSAMRTMSFYTGSDGEDDR